MYFKNLLPSIEYILFLFLVVMEMVVLSGGKHVGLVVVVVMMLVVVMIMVVVMVVVMIMVVVVLVVVVVPVR